MPLKREDHGPEWTPNPGDIPEQRNFEDDLRDTPWDPWLDRRDLPGPPASPIIEFPVGPPELYPLPQPGDELFDVVPGPRPPPTIPVKIVHPPPVPFPRRSHVVEPPRTLPPLDWRRPGASWEEIQAGRAGLIDAGATPGIVAGEPMPSGNFFDDLGDVAVEYIDNLVNPGQAPPLYPDSFNDFPNLPPLQGPVQPGQVIQPTSCAPSGPSPVWKKVCGQYKWVYPKSRRRRALLTERDYNSLLKLQTLKVNQNMTVAIAKALSR